MKSLKLIVLSFLLLSVAACKKTFLSKHTFTLKGTLIEDCSGTPLAFDTVYLFHKTEGWPSSSWSLKTISDANGNFSIPNISKSYTKNFDLSYKDGHGGGGGISHYTPSLNDEDEQIIDLGKLYHTYMVYTAFTLNIDKTKFGAGDTLFVGYDHYNTDTLYPIPSSAMITLTQRHYDEYPFAPEDSILVFWSNHRSHYDSLLSNYQPVNSVLHKFYSKATFCSASVTGNFTIPF